MGKPICVCPKQPVPPGVVHQVKRIYLTRAIAKKAAKESTGRPKPYHCPHCNCWHLTTMKGK